jgi:hypothetical protein
MGPRTSAEFVPLVERLASEGWLRLSHAARLMPCRYETRQGVSRPHADAKCLVRYAVKGWRGVRFEAVCLDGTWWTTSRPAVARFLAAKAAWEMGKREQAVGMVTPPPPAPTPGHLAAMARLRARGVVK